MTFCRFKATCISALIYDSEKLSFSSPSGDIITREKNTYTFFFENSVEYKQGLSTTLESDSSSLACTAL